MTGFVCFDWNTLNEWPFAALQVYIGILLIFRVTMQSDTDRSTAVAKQQVVQTSVWKDEQRCGQHPVSVILSCWISSELSIKQIQCSTAGWATWCTLIEVLMHVNTQVSTRSSYFMGKSLICIISVALKNRGHEATVSQHCDTFLVSCDYLTIKVIHCFTTWTLLIWSRS